MSLSPLTLALKGRSLSRWAGLGKVMFCEPLCFSNQNGRSFCPLESSGINGAESHFHPIPADNPTASILCRAPSMRFSSIAFAASKTLLGSSGHILISCAWTVISIRNQIKNYSSTYTLEIDQDQGRKHLHSQTLDVHVLTYNHITFIYIYIYTKVKRG